MYARRKVSERDILKTTRLPIPVDYFNLSPSSQLDLNYSLDKHNLILKIKATSISLESISDTKDGIIQGKVEDELFIKSRCNSDCRPLLFGANVERYKITFNNNWVNYKPEDMMSLEVKRRGTGIRPGLWMRKPEIFERPKILSRQTADRIIAAFDSDNYYYANTLHGTTITSPAYDPRYVLGVLNSKITTWFYRSNTDEEGKVFAQIKIELLRILPIPRADKASQHHIVKLVEQIESAVDSGLPADITKQESLLNDAVYRLYDLTPAEIALVEAPHK